MRLKTEFRGSPFEFAVLHTCFSEDNGHGSMSGLVLIVLEQVTLTGDFQITDESQTLGSIIEMLKAQARAMMAKHLSEG